VVSTRWNRLVAVVYAELGRLARAAGAGKQRDAAADRT